MCGTSVPFLPLGLYSHGQKKRHPPKFHVFYKYHLMITNLATVLLWELCRIKIVIYNYVKLYYECQQINT